MKRSILLAVTALTLFSCSKGGSNDATPTTNNTAIKITDSVKIGTQIWTSVNYNGETGLNYGNTSTNNALWGKLYTLEEAKAIKLPAGWRLPTIADFTKLLLELGATGKQSDGNYFISETQAKKIMSSSNWLNNIGNNSSGFNAVPAGLYNPNYSGTTSNGYVEATGYNDSFVSAVFGTSSDYVGTYTAKAIFYLYQSKDTKGVTYTSGVITAINTANPVRTSIRFVRDN